MDSIAHPLALGHVDLPMVHLKPAQPGALLMKDLSLYEITVWRKDLFMAQDNFDMHKSQVKDHRAAKHLHQSSFRGLLTRLGIPDGP